MDNKEAELIAQMTNNDTISKLDTMDEQSNLEEKESP